MAKETSQVEEHKFHYDMIRNDEAKIADKLNLNLGYYSFRPSKNFKAVEIIYDTPNNLLSSAGIVLSKQFLENRTFFKVRKISHLPTESKKPSKKFELAKCGSKESPKDFALQVATAINNSFSNIFTIDLSEVVKNTIPKIEITIKGHLYEIAGGTGFSGTFLFENVIYKDLIGHKKVKRKGVTLACPVDDRFERDKENLIEGIERYCKELIPYHESRFEIAQRLLFPKNKGKIGIKKLMAKDKKKKKNSEEEK